MAGSGERIPRLVTRAAADMRSLPLTAMDGFVLSRVDGKLTQRELAARTGLHDDQVAASLDKLLGLNVVAFGPAPPVSAPVSSPSSPGSQGAPGAAAPQPGQVPAAPESAPAAATIRYTVPDDAPELLEPADLDIEVKKRILGIYPRLADLDFYQLLGIERSADKKAVKRAYFELAGVFHPDKYFRKDLGSFKVKMESIFGRVTQAFDALSSKTARVEYDEYLADFDRTRGLDTMLQQALQDMADAEANPTQARPSAPAPAPAPVVPEPLRASHPPAAVQQTMPPVASSGPAPTPAQVAAMDRARRDALAARLRGGRVPSVIPRPPTPVAVTPAPRSDPAEAFKRHHEARVVAAKRQQVDKYMALARESERKNDIVSAAHAYKVVLTLTDDATIRAPAAAAIAQAEIALCDTYLRQAQYEERSESWAEAARSWARAAKGRPKDARAHERAANALMRASGDLHLASTLAQQAIALDPANANYRVTLANVYLAAGLTKNARRELEAAQQLAPDDGTIQSLLKRVTKAG